jgi:hypothetical protein
VKNEGTHGILEPMELWLPPLRSCVFLGEFSLCFVKWILVAVFVVVVIMLVIYLVPEPKEASKKGQLFLECFIVFRGFLPNMISFDYFRNCDFATLPQLPTPFTSPFPPAMSQSH